MNVLVSEWTKFRTVRSTRWVLVAAVVIAVATTTLATALYTRNWDSLSATDRQNVQDDAIGLILQPSVVFTQVVICVLAALTITSEYSTGVIRASVLAVPRRSVMLVAKGVVLLGVVAAGAEVVALASFLMGRVVVSPHVSVGLGDHGVLRSILAYGAYLTLVAAFVYGLGMAVRHTAGVIAAGVIVLFVLPVLATAPTGGTAAKVAALLPASQTAQLALSAHPGALAVPPGVALTAFAAWAVASLAIGGAIAARRDL